jgi:hypothetical protein
VVVVVVAVAVAAQTGAVVVAVLYDIINKGIIT